MVEDEETAEGWTDDGAKREDDAPRCKACDDCHARRDEVSAGAPSWDAIPVLSYPEELFAFPGLTAHTTEKHAGDRDGILAQYAFETDVPCSNVGRHPHRNGLVVRMLCGVILCMGRICGKDSIIGFDGILQDVSRRQKFTQDRAYLAGWASRAEAQLAELRGPARVRNEVLAQMEHVPLILDRLAERAKASGRSAEVLITTERKNLEGKVVKDQTRHEIAGLALFRGKLPEVADIERHLHQFQSFMAPTDAESAKPLLTIARRADKLLERLRLSIREARAFVTEANLQIVLAGTRAPGGVVVKEGSVLRLHYLGHDARLPFEGL